jgi:hypothetical protein
MCLLVGSQMHNLQFCFESVYSSSYVCHKDACKGVIHCGMFLQMYLLLVCKCRDPQSLFEPVYSSADACKIKMSKECYSLWNVSCRCTHCQYANCRDPQFCWNQYVAVRRQRRYSQWNVSADVLTASMQNAEMPSFCLNQ